MFQRKLSNRTSIMTIFFNPRIFKFLSYPRTSREYVCFYFRVASLCSCLKGIFMTRMFFTLKISLDGGGKASNKKKNLRKKGATGRERDPIFMVLWQLCDVIVIVVIAGARGMGNNLPFPRQGKFSEYFQISNGFNHIFKKFSDQTQNFDQSACLKIH